MRIVLFKLLIIILLLYYVARTTGNLIRAIRADERAPRPRMGPPPPYDPYRRPEAPASSGYDAVWRAPAAPRRASDRDVEDARWEDL